MKTIEPSLEHLTQRKAALERKQRQRAREKARSHQAMVDHLEGLKADRMSAEGLARRTQRSQCMLGEVSPGVDARTIEEALEVAREMGRALTISDVQEGESLLDFERRVFDAWVTFDKFVGRNDAGGNFPFAGGGRGSPSSSSFRGSGRSMSVPPQRTVPPRPLPGVRGRESHAAPGPQRISLGGR